MSSGNRTPPNPSTPTPSTQTSHLRILLTNGRLPISLSLARQLHSLGHKIFVVDPQPYHICNFTLSVSQTAQIPAPRKDSDGFIRAVKELVTLWRIDMIFPVWEEGHYLAGCGEKEVEERLFAPGDERMEEFYHPCQFAELVKKAGLGVPDTFLCTSMQDVTRLPVEKYVDGLVLKPVYGRCTGLGTLHIKSSHQFPEGLELDERRPYIAQEHLIGERYASYSIVRCGQVEATGVWPIANESPEKGTKIFLLQQKFHPPICEYIHSLISSLSPPFTGQLSLTLIETASSGVFAISCKPHASDGVFLWQGTTGLARAITGTLPKEYIERPVRPPRRKGLKTGVKWMSKDPMPSFAKRMVRMEIERDLAWEGWKRERDEYEERENSGNGWSKGSRSDRKSGGTGGEDESEF